MYFLHLNTEDDALLLADELENAISEEPEKPSAAAQEPLPRKPVAEPARSSVEFNRSGDPNLPRFTGRIPPDQHDLRKPLPTNATSTLSLDDSTKPKHHDFDPVTPFLGNGGEFRHRVVDSLESPNQLIDHSNESMRRRPLGPRSFMSEAPVERKPLPGIKNQQMNTSPLFQAGKASNDSDRSEASSYDISKPNGSTKSFFITVIRRDPSSGAQWNVGSVFGEDQSQQKRATPNSKKSHFDISVHLTTPGYTLFRTPQAKSHPDGQSHSNTKQAVVSEPGSAPPTFGFDRQVRMEGSNLFSRASKQHKRSQSDALTAKLRGSEDSTSVPAAAGLDDSITDGSGSKGYVFFSPWGGRCKFSTGGGGRSLRCKHTLPDSLSSENAVFDYSRSVTVSELRFNLPHSGVFNVPTAVTNAKMETAELRRISIPKFGHIRDKLSQGSRSPSLPPRPCPTSYAAMYPSDEEDPPELPPRPPTGQRVADSSDEQKAPPVPARSHPFGSAPKSLNEDDDERLDLSIGKEKAGGGNRGKRAKLGKLIIHDEGFKMLDLVVAANMGIWWSVYGVGSDHR